MAYNGFLADRVRGSRQEIKTAFAEKKMFGGVCFMVDDKMCVGIIKDDLKVCIDPKNQDEFLQGKGCRMMDFAQRPMKGYLYVAPEGVDMDEDLDKWVKQCLDFNPKANQSKKKRALK